MGESLEVSLFAEMELEYLKCTSGYVPDFRIVHNLEDAY